MTVWRLILLTVTCDEAERAECKVELSPGLELSSCSRGAKVEIHSIELVKHTQFLIIYNSLHLHVAWPCSNRIRFQKDFSGGWHNGFLGTDRVQGCSPKGKTFKQEQNPEVTIFFGLFCRHLIYCRDPLFSSLIFLCFLRFSIYKENLQRKYISAVEYAMAGLWIVCSLHVISF